MGDEKNVNLPIKFEGGYLALAWYLEDEREFPFLIAEMKMIINHKE